MKILIIEDEKLLQEELILQLKNVEEVEIVHCISTVRESISWLANNSEQIDLIFMDIELADGVCFEIFESISFHTPIIFLTAYSEFAIQAFKVNSIDYLLKPINPKDLVFALDKFKMMSTSKTVLDTTPLKNFYTRPNTKKTKRILIKSGEHFRYIDCSDIAYFVAEDKYTTVVSFNNTAYLIDESLNKLEQSLPNDVFHRPTRKYIVNINAVVKASKYFNSRLKLFIEPSPKSDIIISRNKIKEFLTWMGN